MPYLNSGQDVIKAFMRSLDNTTLKGQAALDQAVKACSNFSGISELIDNFISDCQNAANASAFLKNYCGIDLSNEDTGAITGSDAGGSTVKNAEDIVPETGSMQTFTGTEFTVKGLTVTVPTQSSMVDYQKIIVNGLYSWWVEQSLNLIEESYGSNFGFSSDSSATVKNMKFYFTYDYEGGALATTWHWRDSYTGIATRLEMDVNTYYYNSLTDNINGKPDNDQGYLDRILAHEFTHAVMAANIQNFYALPQCIKEGMAELTHGIDDIRTSTINKLAANPSALRASVDVSNTGTGTSDCYAGGYMLLRYLAKQAAGSTVEPTTENTSIVNSKSDTVVYGTGDGDSIINETSGSRATIIANAGDDTIDNRGDYSVINGGAGNDSIISNSNSMYGWYATINGGTGNDTLTGSTKGDVFHYSEGDGNDIITNYDANDTIQINTGTVNSTQQSGSDVILNVGSGAITLKNASDKSLNLFDANGNAITIGNSTPTSKIIFNTNKNSIVSGTNDNDTIQNNAGGVTVKSGAGDDSIYNSTSGNYTINGAYGYVTIDGGDGNDTIKNNDPYVSLNGGAGDDYIITGNWMNITVRGGTGNDSIEGASSYGSWYQYANGDGNDFITNYNSNDTVQITSGTVNSTQLSGSDLLIAVGTGTITLKDAGNQSLKLVDASKNKITLKGSDDANVITNYSPNTILMGTDKDDSIQNFASNVTIVGGEGDDTVFNVNSNVSIKGDAGNDSIYMSSYDYVTARGGAGNDTIVGAGNYKLIQYADGDGNDLINGYTSNDTIQIISGTVSSSQLSGSNVILTVGNGKITLQNASDQNLNLVDANNNKITIGGSTSSNKIIYNYTNNTVVSGTGTNDTIQNNAGGVTVQSGNGDDSIYNSTHKNNTINGAYGYVTIDAGNGNDSVDSHDPNVSINGGAGNDSINVNNWTDVTVRGGTGNDTVSGLSAYGIIEYAAGDGHDVIYGYNSDATIKLIDKINYSTQIDGTDVIVSVDGGSMLLKNAVGKTLNIIGSTVDTIQTAVSIINTIKNTLLSGSDGNDTIQNRAGGVTITSGAGNDYIYNSTNSSYTVNNSWGYVTIDVGAGNDTVYSNDSYVSINAGDGNDSVVVDGSYMTTIRGGAGADTIGNLGDNNVIEYANGDGGDLIYGYSSTSTICILDESSYSTLRDGSDLIINIGDGSITLRDYSHDAINIVGGNNLNENISKSNYTPNTVLSGTKGADSLKNYAGGVTINAGNGNDFIYNYTDSIYTVNNSWGYVSINGGAGNDTIESYDPYVSIDGGAGDDSIYTSSYSYVTTHGGKGNDTINGTGSNRVLQYAAGDGNDVIIGWDSSSTIVLTDEASYATIADGNDVIISVGSGSMTLKDAVGSNLNIEGGNLIEDSRVNSINNAKNKKKVSGTTSNDFITNSGSNVTIQAGGGDDTITGSDYGEQFWFSYASGKDVITNFGLNDTLKATSGTLTYKTVGDDVIVSIKKNSSVGTITLEGAAQYDFKKVGAYLNAIDTINNTANKKKISGSVLADRIFNSGSNVTIQAGGGDDTITGSDYGEQFWFSYASGKDVITNFGLNDTLKATSGTLTYKTVGDDVIVSIKKNSSVGTITLEGAAQYDFKKNGAYLNAIDTINNTANKKKISGSVLADRIFNSGSNVTIQAGGGDDTITGSNTYGERFQFSYASGNDVITNFGKGDTLQSTSGTLSYKKSGNDYIVTIKKSGQKAVGTITLKDAAENYTLTKSGSNYIAKAKSTSAQLPSDDQYWFLDNSTVEENPLSEIVSTDNAVDLSTDFESDSFNRSTVGTLANPLQTKLRRKHSKS